MFTGLISDVGVVRSVSGNGDSRIVIGANYDMSTVAMGASIACDGQNWVMAPHVSNNAGEETSSTFVHHVCQS